MSKFSVVDSAVLEVLNSGEDIASFFNGLFSRMATCSEIIFPAVTRLVQCFVSARDGAQKVGDFDESLKSFLGASQSRILLEMHGSINADPVLAGHQLSGLIQSINLARESGCRWYLTEPPIVAAVPVSVVSMIERVTKTEVLRDKEGVIVGSRQLENDVTI